MCSRLAGCGYARAVDLFVLNMHGRGRDGVEEVAVSRYCLYVFKI